MNSARVFYRFLIFVIFTLIFLMFLPQEVSAGCTLTYKDCGPYWDFDSCWCCDNCQPGIRICDKIHPYCFESYDCDFNSTPCGGGGGDFVRPVCVNVIPRTPTGGFSQIRFLGFEAGGPGWNIFNGSIYSDGWKVPAYYCGLGYCAARPPHSGSKALHLGLDGGEGTAVYQMGVTPNHVYRVSVWGMGSSCSYGEPDDKCWADVSAYLTTESGGVTKTTRVADPVKQPSWVQGSVTVWARSNTLTLTLQAKGNHCSHNSAGAVFDDLTVEELPTSQCSSQDCLLEVYATDNKGVTQMRFSNDKTNWTSWESYEPVKFKYSLGANGRVWAQFKDGAGNESAISDSCSGTCAINQPPDCTSMSPSHGTIIKQGESVPLTVQVSDSDGSVSKVEFYYISYPQADYCTASWTKIGTDSNGADGWGVSWNTSGIAEGDYYVVANVYDDKNAWCAGNPGGTCGVANSACSDCRPVLTVKIFADPWFQTKEGDVHAGGNITVSVPDGEYFCEIGDGGTPGVVSHQTGTPDFSPGSVSETGWLANTSFSRKKYEYFRQLLDISPDDEDSFDSFADIGDDIVYYSSNGVDINTGAGSFPAGKKAAILVNGNVNINTNISVPDGSFLAFIALGNIEVADSVSQINGVYITDSKFEAGTNNTTALECYGTFVANSFEMEGRDLGTANETTPGVKFIYRPDFWLNAPAELFVPSYTWQELAP